MNEVKVKIGNGEVSVPQLVPGQAMQPSTKLERLFLGMGWTGRFLEVIVIQTCLFASFLRLECFLCCVVVSAVLL